jgi:hypothetical protein
MPKFNHYQSVSSLLSEPEWLNVINWDLLVNGLISYGGDGNDLILLAGYGEFASSTGGAEYHSFAYGGVDDDTFILPTYASRDAGVDAPLLAMTIDGSIGIDTLAFSDPRLGNYGVYLPQKRGSWNKSARADVSSNCGLYNYNFNQASLS